MQLFDRKDAGEDLLSEQIARIEIRQKGRFFHYVQEGIGAIGAPLVFPFLLCVESKHFARCFVPMTVLFTPLWAYPAVTTPFFLAADGIAFFIPPKVYEIVH